MMKRREFIRNSALAPAIGVLTNSWVAAAPARDFPRLTFYGATQQVSGSCHLLEASGGLYLVDCGRFVGDSSENEQENKDFPFDPREVKALLLTHAHADHQARLPLLYKKGFRGKIYCTDATRDLTILSSRSSPNSNTAQSESDEEPLFDSRDVREVLKLFEAVPYNTKSAVDKLTVRYTDAGHILGSAMIEVWADGRKILFGGDMGPDDSPILHSPASHFSADAVLVESTYGPSRRTPIDYQDFGKKINEVLSRGGDVLIPTFAIHKSQIMIYVLQQLVQSGVISREVPIYCDSGTVHSGNRIYDAYQNYYDNDARKFADKHGSLFYMGRYREGRTEDFLKAHNGVPSIFVATSGMLAYAASPRHLEAMAGNPKNAVFLPGYQAPGSVGRRLLDGEKSVELTIQSTGRQGQPERRMMVDVELEVASVSGFASHAHGQQVLEWLSRFEHLGPVFVVHGSKENTIQVAQKISEMGLASYAPARNDSFTVKSERVRPGSVPELQYASPLTPAPVDR